MNRTSAAGRGSPRRSPQPRRLPVARARVRAGGPGGGGTGGAGESDRAVVVGLDARGTAPALGVVPRAERELGDAGGVGERDLPAGGRGHGEGDAVGMPRQRHALGPAAARRRVIAHRSLLRAWRGRTRLRPRRARRARSPPRHRRTRDAWQSSMGLAAAPVNVRSKRRLLVGRRARPTPAPRRTEDRRRSRSPRTARRVPGGPPCPRRARRRNRPASSGAP